MMATRVKFVELVLIMVLFSLPLLGSTCLNSTTATGEGPCKYAELIPKAKAILEKAKTDYNSILAIFNVDKSQQVADALAVAKMALDTAQIVANLSCPAPDDVVKAEDAVKASATFSKARGIRI